MNIMTPPLSTSSIVIVSNRSPLPQSAQHYVTIANQAIEKQNDLLNSSRNYKILALASLTILTATPFILAMLPVMTVSVVFASIIMLGSASKIYDNSSQITIEKAKFANHLLGLRLEIYTGFVTRLSKIFKGQYDTTERTGRVRCQIMTLKDDVNLEELQKQLQAWKEESRAIHCINHVLERKNIILGNNLDSKTDLEITKGKLTRFFGSPDFLDAINQISDVVEQLLENDQQREITDLIQSINVIDTIFRANI